MEKNKRNKIIGLSMGILVVLIIVVSSTYAYWQITRTQENPNDIVAACLSLNLENANADNTGIKLENQWPISDEEGKKLTGYTFTVTNNCDQEVNYIVGLNSVEISETTNYMSYDSLKVQLDDNTPQIYGDLSDIEYADSENEYVARASKQLSVETLTNNGVNTHTIKIWIDENASIDDAGKSFSGQVFITGGQGIMSPNIGGNGSLAENCFDIDEEGTITGYNYSCGTDVVVPAEINGIQIKTINSTSFVFSNMKLYALYNETTEEEKYIYYVTDENIVSDVTEYLKTQICDDPETCTLADMEAAGLILITTEEDYNNFDWDSYETDGYIIDGPYPAYYDVEAGEEGEAFSQITSLDLSDAIYLETIEAESFKNNEKLATLILPEDGVLTTIGESAFENNGITSLNIPDSVTTIENSVFKNNKISEIEFPDNVQTIGNSAFQNNNISTLDISVPNIGDSAFQGNKLTAVTIGSQVEIIGTSAFRGEEGYNQISSLIFEDTAEHPSQLTSIGMYGFMRNNLTSVKLPENLKTIGYMSLSYNKLTKIVVPASVTAIHDFAFSSNLTLTEIIIKRTEEDAAANMSLSNQWNWMGGDNTVPYPVTYNPNYTE